MTTITCRLRDDDQDVQVQIVTQGSHASDLIDAFYAATLAMRFHPASVRKAIEEWLEEHP